MLKIFKKPAIVLWLSSLVTILTFVYCFDNWIARDGPVAFALSVILAVVTTLFAVITLELATFRNKPGSLYNETWQTIFK